MSLHPESFEEMVGNPKILNQVKEEVRVSRELNKAFAHSLFYGPPGTGKTTYAKVIAKELGVRMHTIIPTMVKATGFQEKLRMMKEFDILLIDEIHSLPREIAEELYHAVEYGELPSLDRKIQLPKFTLLGATTTPGEVERPLYDRFTNKWELRVCNKEEVRKMIEQLCQKEDYQLLEEDVLQIIANARGVPRTISMITKKIIDYRRTNSCMSTKEIIQGCEFEYKGFTKLQLQYLEILFKAEQNNMKTTYFSKETLAGYLNVVDKTITNSIEPYLMRMKCIKKGPAGRSISWEGKVLIEDYWKSKEAEKEEGESANDREEK